MQNLTYETNFKILAHCNLINYLESLSNFENFLHFRCPHWKVFPTEEILEESSILAESAWEIPYLNIKIFLFRYQSFKSDLFLSLTFPISLSDFYLFNM